MSWEKDASFGEKVASLCCKNYADKLGKKGKPQAGKEWTLLAGVVVAKETDADYDRHVVSMGTGSKCLGQSKMSAKGDVVNDSHAEVIARRGFLRYLYGQLQLLSSGEDSEVLEVDPDCPTFRCRIRHGVSIHMFTSHTPCGDASIFPKSSATQDYGEMVTSQDQNKRSHDDESSTVETKKMKRAENDDKKQQTGKSDPETSVPDDIYRTGAKHVPGEASDPHMPGRSYHVTGVLRIKPGRGDRTLSLSCSDKFARWSIMGIQGALLSHFFKSPIYLSSIIIGKCPYNEEAMRRAIVDRIQMLTDLPPGYCVTVPTLLSTNITFPDSRQILDEKSDKAVPGSAAVVWWLCGDGTPVQEAMTHGRRQGITAKNIHRPMARVGICKFELFKCFKDLIQQIPTDKRPSTLSGELEAYEDYKNAAWHYQESCTRLFSDVFKNWPRTPQEFKQFTIDSNT